MRLVGRQDVFVCTDHALRPTPPPEQTHFTNMFMRNYPDRITTQRLLAEDRYKSLASPELRTMPRQAMIQQAAGIGAQQRSAAEVAF